MVLVHYDWNYMQVTLYMEVKEIDKYESLWKWVNRQFCIYLDGKAKKNAKIVIWRKLCKNSYYDEYYKSYSG